MPPKKATAATSSTIYIVISHSSGVDSVHATLDSANKAAEALGDEDIEVKPTQLVGGTISITPVAAAKPARAPAKPKVAAKPKAAAQPKAESEEEDDEEGDEEEEEKPVAAKPVKKTKPVAEQKAANATKPKKGPIDESKLPENVRRVLNGSGAQLAGKQICVTGVPPTIGRKNAEKIVVAYGGKLMKALSKKTDLVVIGNDAGPKKLDQIEGYGIDSTDEDGLIALIEGGSSGAKRSAEDEDEDMDDADEEESEEEKPAPKGKKAKR